MSDKISIDTLKYSGGEVIAVLDDAILAKTKDGQVKTIPLPKFKHRQIVKTKDTYFSPKSFTRLIDPTYTDNRGWVYGENYIDRTGCGSGCGFSFEESDFLPLDDARDILFAKRIELTEEISSLTSKTKRLSEELGKVNFAIDLTNPTPHTNG